MLTESTWIQSIRFYCNECLRYKFLIFVEGAHSCFLTSSITIEGKDNFAAECIIIHQESANDANMVWAKGSSARCDRCSNSCQMAGHNICIAFNNYHLALPCNLFLRHIQAVENLALLINRSLRGVEIFRSLIFGVAR